MSTTPSRSRGGPAPAPEDDRSEDLIMNKGWGGIHPGVFWPSLIVRGVACLFAIGFPEATDRALGAIQQNVVSGFGSSPSIRHILISTGIGHSSPRKARDWSETKSSSSTKLALWIAARC